MNYEERLSRARSEYDYLGNVYIPLELVGEFFTNEIEVLKKEIGNEIDFMYFLPCNFAYSFMYKKDNVFIDIFSLQWEVWKTFNFKERIIKQNEYMNELIKEKKYNSVFAQIDKPILIERYIALFDEIPKEQKYDCFRQVWVRSEFGFDDFGEELLEKIFTYREYSETHKEEMENLRKLTDNQEIITIYRGEAENSTDSLSWSLDKKVAEFFANRFSANGTIYEAEVNIKDVYDFISVRSENELLINPNKVIYK